MTEELNKLQGQLFRIHNSIVNKLKAVWQNSKPDDNSVDTLCYSKLSVISFTHWAAIVAVDCGMDVDQFLKVCEANFREAYEKAPKWS